MQISRVRVTLLGAILGLAWGSGLRAWMAVFAITTGGSSSFTWSETFLSVLLPTTVVGAALGWAEHARRTGGRGWRWTALAPLLFVVIPALILGAGDNQRRQQRFCPDRNLAPTVGRGVEGREPGVSCTRGSLSVTYEGGITWKRQWLVAKRRGGCACQLYAKR